MPSDIRSFFGGKPSSAPAETPKPTATKTKGRGRPRKIVEDDDDDDEVEEVKPAKKATPKKKQPEPEPTLEETTADDFFGKGSKPKRSEAVRPKTRSKPAAEETPKKAVNGKKAETETNGGRSSGRKKKDTSYVELDDDDFPDDDNDVMDADGAADNFKSDAKVGRRAGDDYKEGSDDDDDKPLVPKRAERSGKQKTLKDHDQDDFKPDTDIDMKDTNMDDDFLVPDDDEEIVEDKPAKKAPAKASKKRKSVALEEDEDEDDLEMDDVKPAAKKRAAPKKSKKEPVQDSAEIQAIFDSIPTIEPPPPPPKSGEEGEKPKFKFGGQHANSAAPVAAIDMSELPQGQDNCLAGLTFVFTGQMGRLGREQGQSLVKQYGGKVTTAPSKKTSYVVLGEDAGPKKLATIQQHSLKVINEEGLFELIKRLPANGGDSAAADKNAEKLAKEADNIRKAAEEMDKQERAQLAAAKPKPKPQASTNGQSANGQSTSQQSSKGKEAAAAAGPDTRLWTVRYAPTQLTQICGNKSQVDKLARWLRAFPKNQRTGFKMGGADGSGTHRAIIIHGPPGIGKTTAAHLVAKLEGYDIVESNASDTRSKKLVETGLKGVLSTTSLMGYFAADNSSVDASKKKLVLIMDEVDGMSAGDRGGVGALAAVCKKSQIPMILICNDRKLPKMKPFDYVTYDLPFRRPTTDMIRSRISTIAFREGLKIPPNVINALIEGSGADIRQVVNMISTAKIDSQTLSFEEGKDMSKAWEKHIVLKPWDMVAKILGGGLFNPAAHSTLNEKQELYFNDHEFAPLMLQENYLGTNPARTNKFNDNPRRKRLATLDLVSKAADSISDGDLVDRMIHGSQQQWGLMPTHAMFSFVRPASYIYGSLAGHGQTRFTAWLGKNSSQSKMVRIVKEIQGHMRLRVSADRHEVRQTYLPLLFERLVRALEREGKEAVPEIIALMDSYFLTREDWEGILELGVGEAGMEGVKIESQAKATFTRLYNQQSHPLPFMKASQVLNPKRAPAKERPDLEEAQEESEEEAVDAAEAVADDDEDVDLSKDKYVKQPKKRKAAAAGGAKAGAASKKARKGKAKVGVDDEDDEGEGEEEVKPKAGAKGKGKGRAKK
ncbi:hypothetical protein LTR36_010715 [Oleoguttula mirabilis]|uniref:Replication factor C subunit 1 n=1 Tax=Oleoguttula mirabilis TaxID=1507867 RepID=A0AAV9JTU1_9PEZI|nr:hypothetical protein LTR36_010715 [Oleoguttula mirabilis]